MSFSRWYPVSTYYYDPAIQPSKPIANLAAKDESNMRRVPKGRYDTTYRREYLNFHHDGFKSPRSASDEQLNQQQQQQMMRDSSSLNRYPLLPPISNTPNNNYNQQQYQNNSIDHIITEPPNYMSQPPPKPQVELYGSQYQQNIQETSNDTYLPIDPIYLSPAEDQALNSDVARELANYSSNQLKSLYTDMTNYDPSLTGYAHYHYIQMVAVKNNLPLSESLLRFVMSRFVSPEQERGHVNYEELVKFLAKCLGDLNNKPQKQPPPQSLYSQSYSKQTNLTTKPTEKVMNEGGDRTDKFDPDEQAILRLMHENMREWDQVNLVDCDNLRKKFYEIDPYNRYILTQREIEDVLYKNRVPIQRSLIFQILEKYCKVATGQYRWPAFVDFLEKTYNFRLPNRKKINYAIREDEKSDPYLNPESQFTYRSAQLDTLKSKASEEERLEEINKQIYNLQSLKQETKQRIESRLSDAYRGESWFTRFMRLANAMYSHRVNAGIEFALPKEEARRLVTAYNTVYELNIPEQSIEDGLNRCTLKGNVVIDDLLKVLSRVK